jgi:putative transposase
LYERWKWCGRLGMAKIEPYTSDLTDIEWELVRRLLPVQGKLGRPPRYERRLLLNAIFYITRSGCPWRDLPHDFPKWRLVYYYFSKWQQQGVWEQINAALRDRVRLAHGKKKPRRLRPSTAKALRWLASPESAALMQARRFWGESDTCWSTPWD